MPNKRDPNKTGITIFVDKNVKEVAKEILDSYGMSITEYLLVSLLELIHNDKNEKLKILNETDGRTKKGKARITSQKILRR